MGLTSEEVKKVAELARLPLSEEEVEQYCQQLSAVLDYVEQLNELSLDGVTPTTHAVAQQNRLREDETRPSLGLEDVLYNAPAHTRRQFLIQAVLEDG